MHDGGEVELVARAAEAPQAHAFEAMVGLQVGEAHFDSLPLIAGSLVLRRFHESTRDVASLFVDVPGYFAPGDVRTTPRLQRASIAIELARPIEDRSDRRELCRSSARPCRKALTCAHRMLEALGVWNRGRERHGQPTLAIGIGLNYGPAVVRDVGSKQGLSFTVIGDTVKSYSQILVTAAWVQAAALG